MDTPAGGNGVRISNGQIYRLLLETSREVASVRQTVQESLVPQVKSNTAALATKVEKDDFDEHVKRVATLELRVWAAIIGVLVAISGLNISGLI